MSNRMSEILGFHPTSWHNLGFVGKHVEGVDGERITRPAWGSVVVDLKVALTTAGTAGEFINWFLGGFYCTTRSRKELRMLTASLWYLLAALAIPGPQAVTPNESTEVLRKLKLLAEDILVNDPEVLELYPKFEVQRDKGFYVLNPCVKNTDRFDRSLPYNAILENLVCAAAYRNPSSGFPADLRSRIAQDVDTLSLSFISQLESVTDPEARQKAEIQYRERTSALFKAADQTLKELASGLDRASVVLPASLVPVKIQTDPPNGIVRLMKRLTYRQCNELALCGPEQINWPWLVVTQSIVSLAGRYRYRVDWGQGQVSEGDIEITSPEPIIFRKPLAP